MLVNNQVCFLQWVVFFEFVHADVNELNELVLATALVAVTVIASHCSRSNASTFVAIQLSRCILRTASIFPAIHLRPYAAIYNEYNVAGLSSHAKVFVVMMRYIGPCLDMEKETLMPVVRRSVPPN